MQRRNGKKPRKFKRLKNGKKRLPGVLLLALALSAVVVSEGSVFASAYAAKSPSPLTKPPISVQLIPEVSTAGTIAKEGVRPARPAQEQETPEKDSLPETAPPVENEPVQVLPPPQTGEGSAADFSDAVFLGDSRTEGFALYSGLKEGRFVYAVGATVESVLQEKIYGRGQEPRCLLEELGETEFETLYIMLGINELGLPGDELFRTQTTALLETLRSRWPEREIVIQSILPVSRKQDEKNSYVNNEKIRVYNAVWQELAEQYGCRWLDVGAAVQDEEGYLPDKLSYDGIHLNPSGCRLWLDCLRTQAANED